MNKIDEFLEKQRRVIEEDREETLISLGLFEKEYSPNGAFSRKYPDYDVYDGEKRYYRKKAISVTEEQWEEIKVLREKTEEIEARRRQALKKNNVSVHYGKKKWIPVFVKKDGEDAGQSKISFWLRVMAIVWGLIGIFLGIVQFFDGEPLLGILVFTSVAVTAVLLFAFAEILSGVAELLAIARDGFQYSGPEDKK